jgi:hypothetical protein
MLPNANSISLNGLMGLLVAAVANLFIIVDAHADVCIAAGDAVALEGALDATELEDASPVTIKLERGSYTGSFFHKFLKADVTLLGGYAPSPSHDCASAGRLIDARQTKIEGISELASWLDETGKPAGDVLVRIDNVTLDGGNINTPNVLISKVDFLQFAEIGWRGSSAADGEIKVENAVFRGGVTVHLVSDHTAQLNHVTVDGTLNLDDGFVWSGDKQVSIWNSIVWDDGLIKLSHDPAYGWPISVDLHDVDYGTIQSSPIDGVYFDTVLHSTQQDPLWTDPAQGDYSLSGGASSPVINHGTVSVLGGEPQTDIVGNDRKIGGIPDLGAIESLFEGNETLVVTNTNDVAAINDPLYHGSLRWAIDQANVSGGTSLITFNLPCPSTIKLNSPLPTVWVPLTIDGYSAAGALPNTDPGSLFNGHLCVIIKPVSSLVTPAALIVPAAAQGASLTVQGLWLGGFSQGIELFGGSDHQIVGNMFGGLASGFQIYGFEIAAVHVDTSTPVIIGGSNPAERNVFLDAASGAGDAAGVLVGALTNNTRGGCQIVGNLFGVWPDGTSADPNNENGILIQGNGCTVLGNYLAGNIKDAIRLVGGSHNVIQNNLIGPRITPGLPFFYNPGAGIRITNGANDNIIGAGDGFYGPAYSYENFISTMNGGGIIVSNSTGNTIRGNAIYGNGLTTALNIDLGGDGPTPNDPNDADGGANTANDLMNYPVPNGVSWGTSDPPQFGSVGLTIRGQLDTQAGSYWIDAYYDVDCSATGRGGGTWVGSSTYTAFFTGPGAFEVPVYIPFFSYDSAEGRISLTATSTGDHQSTSEFSRCLSVDTIFTDGLER